MTHQRLSSIRSVWSAAEDGVLLVVDGQSLERLISGGRDREHHEWGRTPFTREGVEYCDVAGWVDPTVRWNPDLAPGEIEVGVCPACADLACGSLVLWLRRDGETVMWERPHWGVEERDVAGMSVDERQEYYEAEPGDASDDPLGTFPSRLVFPAAEYDAALAGVSRLFRDHPRLSSRARGGVEPAAGTAADLGAPRSGRRRAKPWWRRAARLLRGGRSR